MTTSHAAVADGGQATSAGYPRRWLAAIVMIVGALMDMIDVTIVNVALPSIRRDLNASATQLEWVVSGYMLAFAAALIIAGNLGDKFGRKRVFLIGAALFGLASLAAGLSGSGAELIAARVVQGVAAATMAPQVLATFRVIFGREERGKAFGIYGAMLGFASAIGLVLGGVLTDANLFGWGWRSVFYVNVPVAVAALIAGARLVPETRDPAARRPNLPGAVLLAGSLVAIVYPLLEGRGAALAARRAEAGRAPVPPAAAAKRVQRPHQSGRAADGGGAAVAGGGDARQRGAAAADGRNARAVRPVRRHRPAF